MDAPTEPCGCRYAKDDIGRYLADACTTHGAVLDQLAVEVAADVAARPEFDVRSDGRTVWVDAATGFTVARFGLMGVDVHTPDSTGCLDCTHGPTGPAEWDRFVASVHHHYGVVVSDEHRPDHCHEEGTTPCRP